MKNSLSILLILFISNCNPKQNFPNVQGYLNQVDSELLNQNVKNIVYVPFDACNSCVHGIISFVSENPSVLDKNLFILVKFNSLKSYKIKYGQEIFDHQNMVFDSGTKYFDFNFKFNSPVLLKLKKGTFVVEGEILLEPQDYMFHLENNLL
ncbi:hypothetical protein MM213_11025 [Belliella sp. R4-6]|uniref:NlpE N-terminal domain-containing protein n=1 Tax=Belliella alkalica TaxID=1730871 RepID=A0ABS9VC52_9BACT|nr:hypothetical protein [Belliella alkalica]MCH7414022.1 hypothetical protein [Belliella alkalica]